ncbi:MAG: hypothetical protein ACRDH2_06730 [Anaerolineales bacterium]
MRYTIRRISLSHVARVGCALGWLAALPPALCFAGVAVALLQRVHQALQQVTPLTLSILGQEVVRLDWLDVFRLQPVADRLAQWTDNLGLTFTLLTLLLTISGSVLVVLSGLLVGGAYNLLGRAGWGLIVELAEVKTKPN